MLGNLHIHFKIILSVFMKTSACHLQLEVCLDTSKLINTLYLYLFIPSHVFISNSLHFLCLLERFINECFAYTFVCVSHGCLGLDALALEL